MTISVAQFRADFPEFNSSTTYSNSAITYWLTLAYNLLNAARWSTMLDTGAELFAAHNLVLEAKAQADAAAGNIPGREVGAVSAKSVDSVSINYDTAVGVDKEAGHWNLTVYGTRFKGLVNMFGAGPVVVGIGYDPTGGLNGSGWAGPDVTPGMTNFS